MRCEDFNRNASSTEKLADGRQSIGPDQIRSGKQSVADILTVEVTIRPGPLFWLLAFAF